MSAGGQAPVAAVHRPDNFKQVNDRHGHDAGDALLRLFAQRAQTLLERHRQQHPHTYSAFARLSGDEFAIPERCRPRTVRRAARPAAADPHLCPALSRGTACIRTMPTPSPSCFRADTTAIKCQGRRQVHGGGIQQRAGTAQRANPPDRGPAARTGRRQPAAAGLHAGTQPRRCGGQLRSAGCAGSTRCWALPSSSPLP